MAKQSANHRLKVGVFGTGDISDAYLSHARRFDSMEIVACANRTMEKARHKAAAHNIKALKVDALLADPDIDIIINLTLPQVHAQISTEILKAGKHVYSEKPLTVDLHDAKELLDLARARGLRVGCAPDTFLGGAHQTVRGLLDAGAIGQPLAGTAFMMCPGHESWHPNPGFYYRKGGGPVMDMAPYYLTALINLLGPVDSVCAMASRSAERVATSEAARGQRLPVEVDTHSAGVLRFENGAVITMVMSFDVHAHLHTPLELYGTGGSLLIPDPNCFGGEVRLCAAGNAPSPRVVPLTHGYTDNARSLGVADMAAALHEQRPHRASGEMAYHVLEVMHALAQAAAKQSNTLISSTCSRPEALAACC